MTIEVTRDISSSRTTHMHSAWYRLQRSILQAEAKSEQLGLHHQGDNPRRHFGLSPDCARHHQYRLLSPQLPIDPQLGPLDPGKCPEYQLAHLERVPQRL